MYSAILPICKERLGIFWLVSEHGFVLLQKLHDKCQQAALERGQAADLNVLVSNNGPRLLGERSAEFSCIVLAVEAKAH